METPGSLPMSHPGTKGDPQLLLRGQKHGRDNFVLSPAQPSSGQGWT